MTRRISRRSFVKAGAGGLAAIAVGNVLDLPWVFTNVARAQDPVAVQLTIREALVEMIDLLPVYHWVFEAPTTGPLMPGPTIIAEEGAAVTVSVANTLDEEHSWAIRQPSGITHETGGDPGPFVPPAAFIADTGPIAPGGNATITFTAPAAGTYIYEDALNSPVNRVLGLQGMFISTPVPGATTPYTTPTPNVARLFADLGTAAHFPGTPWNPARTWLWIFSSIDPRFNAIAEAGGAIDPADFVANSDPLYWMISGKTGFFSSHDERIKISGFVGNPALIRVMNVGITTHSPHIHGNHVYPIARNGIVLDNLVFLDTWSVRPGETVDILHPFIQPPDIPVFPPVQEPFPLRYPMHCHIEMSQTAGGANYPQGLLTDWELAGPLGGEKGGPAPTVLPLPISVQGTPQAAPANARTAAHTAFAGPRPATRIPGPLDTHSHGL